MQEVHKVDFTNEAVSRLQRGRTLHYMRKENRDIAYELIKRAGLKARRTTVRTQNIHPEYIEDYAGTIETGFGNSMSNMMFKVLYNLEIISEYDKRMY